jgi:hypothetical protein
MDKYPSAEGSRRLKKLVIPYTGLIQSIAEASDGYLNQQKAKKRIQSAFICETYDITTYP